MSIIDQLRNQNLCKEAVLPITNPQTISLYKHLQGSLTSMARGNKISHMWHDEIEWDTKPMHKHSSFNALYVLIHDINAMSEEHINPTPRDLLIIGNHMRHLPPEIQLYIMENINSFMYFYNEVVDNLPYDVAVSRAVDRLIEANIYSDIYHDTSILPKKLSRRFKELYEHYKAEHGS